jgi:hypothetical protein
MSFVSLHLLSLYISSPGPNLRPRTDECLTRTDASCLGCAGTLGAALASAVLLTFGHAVQLSRSPVLPTLRPVGVLSRSGHASPPLIQSPKPGPTRENRRGLARHLMVRPRDVWAPGLRTRVESE